MVEIKLPYDKKSITAVIPDKNICTWLTVDWNKRIRMC